MRTVKIYDMTLRESDAVKANALTFKQKLEVARGLDRLKVDAIELAPISDSRADQLSNKTIASMVTTAISAAVNILSDNVEETWESIKSATHPQLQVVAPVSTVQMEYDCHMKASKMLDRITEQVKKCRFYCETVEFSAVDATRAEPAFLYQAISIALASGASKITVCDTAGICLPTEFADFITSLKENVPALVNAELFVQVSDEMHMSAACAAAAIMAGADGVKCTATNCGHPTIEEIAHFVQVKGANAGLSTNIRTTEMNRVVGQLNWILEPQEESASPFSNMALGEVQNVCLDINDGISEVTKVVRQLGYDLSEEDNAKVYEAFLRVAAKKHFVGTKELESIIATSALQVPSTYRVENYVINSGNVITATANLLLEKNGEKFRGIGVGDGPIDAAFSAIEQIIGHRYELDDFQIQTVTEGREAMGSALVKLRSAGKVYSGNGISTDIIGASIRAYISALNKIVYEEA